jgi:hypothetical protein
MVGGTMGLTIARYKGGKVEHCASMYEHEVLWTLCDRRHALLWRIQRALQAYKSEHQVSINLDTQKNYQLYI